MPFKSEAQRKWMFANHVQMAKRWAEHTPKGKKLPEHVKKGNTMDSESQLEMSERRAAFKRGFLTKLAEVGVTPSQFFEHLKTAADAGGLDLGGLADNTVGALGTLGKYGLGLAIAAPVVAGGASGAAEAMLTSPSVEDVGLLRKKEMLLTYQRAKDEIKQRVERRRKEQGGVSA